jgi:hypothetical protein
MKCRSSPATTAEDSTAAVKVLKKVIVPKAVFKAGKSS